MLSALAILDYMAVLNGWTLVLLLFVLLKRPTVEAASSVTLAWLAKYFGFYLQHVREPDAN